MRSPVGQKHPQCCPKLAGQDGTRPGSALQPEVYTKPSRWISFVPGDYVIWPRSVPDLGAEGRLQKKQ